MKAKLVNYIVDKQKEYFWDKMKLMLKELKNGNHNKALMYIHQAELHLYCGERILYWWNEKYFKK